MNYLRSYQVNYPTERLVTHLAKEKEDGAG